jgi:hypothetical protein
LLPAEATLVGLDEHTALVRDAAGEWRIDGPGVATVYRKGQEPETMRTGELLELGPPDSASRVNSR